MSLKFSLRSGRPFAASPG